MTAPERMHRLLMGDVGTGQDGGGALRHAAGGRERLPGRADGARPSCWPSSTRATLTELLAPLGIVPELLIGRMSAAEKAAVRERLGQGGARLVVGTHALMQESVAFHRLGLVVIDEQHRFGVEQRAAPHRQGVRRPTCCCSPPRRSRARSRSRCYGDLDVSRFGERPPGRGAITRTAHPRAIAARAGVRRSCEAECRAGRQAYVVLPGHRGIGEGRPARGHHDGGDPGGGDGPDLVGGPGARPAQGRRSGTG